MLCPLTAELQTVCKQLWDRVYKLEVELYDNERLFLFTEIEVSNIELSCSHLT